MEISEDAYLEHYGTPRHSGRYPWGSGEDGQHDQIVPTRNKSFLDNVNDLKKQGLSDLEIARGMGISTTQLRARRSNAKNEQKQDKIDMMQRLKDKGYSTSAIGRRMNMPEATVRSFLAPGAKDRADLVTTTANMLKDRVAEKTYVDVGAGQEHHIGVSKTQLTNAIAMLTEQGYTIHQVKVEQQGTGKQTTVKVLAPPGTTLGDAYRNKSNIQPVTKFTTDGGLTFMDTKPPRSISLDRVGIVYGDKGGAEADGVIYVRPGVKDISLGGAGYAQVRVKVGDTHYLKGMAMYKDDLPEGKDLVFNTNKSDTGHKLDALKPLEDDPDNPFSALISRQIFSDHDKEHPESVMNLVNEEGDWTKWSKTIASQVLSKQSPELAKAQLEQGYDARLSDFNTITSLTNPTVKKRLLKGFSDETDSAAVHLKAAQLPRQGWHVLLPMSSLPENEIYAPNYRNGEPVVLIRYPHGGTFEIPELTVNNAHPPAKKLLGNARDAVAVNPKVAERLSGADFDGDTVLVIPNSQKKIKSSPALEGLKDFNPKLKYKMYEGMPVMTAQQKALEMGAISNLITDMTIKQASHAEIARAVKHSMVVIDAENHKLNYKKSAIDNNIAQLKAKYQGGERRGASTLISKAKAETRIPERKARLASRGGPIDPVTGRKVFEETGRINFKSGKPAQTKSKGLADVEDAHLLSSGTPIETLYANHSNKLKSLSNQARLEYLATPSLVYSPLAKKKYHQEVDSLNIQLALAERNAPLERQAQLLADTMVKTKRAANPNMDQATLKKIRGKAQETARARVGAKKIRIDISAKEWEAIQAGAISDAKLGKILDNTDLDKIKDLATPHVKVLMTTSKINQAKLLLDSGASRAEVAERLGVSLSTLDKSTSVDRKTKKESP